MKSVKKRFKNALNEIQQSAVELALLTSDIQLLENVSALVQRVLMLCTVLELQAATLNKADFAAQMAENRQLIELDALVDEDILSVLEERFFVLLAEREDRQLIEFFQQLLQKLEKQHAELLNNIQKLGQILERAD